MINANKPYFWLYEFKAFNQSAVLCTRLTIGLPALIQSVTDAHSFQRQTSKCLLKKRKNKINQNPRANNVCPHTIKDVHITVLTFPQFCQSEHKMKCLPEMLNKRNYK